MKKFLYIAVAAIAALSSCSSDTDLLSEVAGNGAKVFTARFEGTNSRATLNGMTPNWEADDVISINGAEYKAKTAGATSEFEATSGNGASGTTYTAYFPASLYQGGTTVLPATQTYTAGKFNMPMYATSTTTDLQFKNLCAVLAVKVTSDDIATLKSIKVKSDRKLNGTFTVQDNKAVLADDGTNELLIDCGGMSITASGTTFYIAIPAYDDAAGYHHLTIYLSADGSTYKQAMSTRKAEGLGALGRNKMFEFDYECNAMQLWANGPMFADSNVLDVPYNPYGQLLPWGATYINEYMYKEESTPLTKEEDFVVESWGDNWRIPTATEWEGLLANCDYEQSFTTKEFTTPTPNNVKQAKCAVFTGRGDFADYSIFLPAAGLRYNFGAPDYRDELCAYWSSTPCEDEERAFVLSLNPTVLDTNAGTFFCMSMGLRSTGRAFRPVLAE